jgi:hypothetical protein
MDKLRPAIVSLKLLANMKDPVGGDVIRQRIEEFVAFHPDTDQKIENPELLRHAASKTIKAQAGAGAFSNLSIS